MKRIAMIPARYGATRFPGKLMQVLGDKTVIRHTYDATMATGLFDEVVVVTDSEIIFSEITNAGGKAVMSLHEHESGSDRIAEAASVENEKDLYQAQLDIFLNPNDPAVIEQARIDGIPDAWMAGARNSPVYKMAVEWKVALPLHPEYRTLPMVWYVPPLSPINSAANAGHVGLNGEIPDVGQLRIPVQYLANLLTAGDTGPVVRALERMLAMRAYQRSKHVDNVQNLAVLEQTGLSVAEVEEMYQIMAIANYEDRFVIPTSHREYAENAFDLRGGCGFSFGNGCSDGASETSLFGGTKARTIPIKSML